MNIGDDSCRNEFGIKLDNVGKIGHIFFLILFIRKKVQSVHQLNKNLISWLIYKRKLGNIIYIGGIYCALVYRR